MNIEIKNEIYEKIKKRIEKSEFSSVEEYVNFVLEEVIKENEGEITEEEEEQIKERLRSLGYL
jgi:Arc/MetJ-type ribon-helix-helix transcriptional regulator